MSRNKCTSAIINQVIECPATYKTNFGMTETNDENENTANNVEKSWNDIAVDFSRTNSPASILSLLEVVSNKLQTNDEWGTVSMHTIFQRQLLRQQNPHVQTATLKILEQVFLGKPNFDGKHFQRYTDSLLQLWPNHPESVCRLLTHAIHCKCMTKGKTPELRKGLHQQIAQLTDDDDENGRKVLLIQFVKEFMAVDSSFSKSISSFVISNQALLPEDCARILWTWAVAEPSQLAGHPSIWEYVQECTLDGHVAAVVGNLVSGASDEMLIPQYPWLTPFLCEKLIVSESDDTKRRVVRTLRCMGSKTVLRHAATLCFGALTHVLDDSIAGDGTRILTCQTIISLIESPAPVDQRIAWLPTLQMTLIRMVGQGTHHPKLILTACECLMVSLQSSPWKMSVECFDETFLRQLKTIRHKDITTRFLSHIVVLRDADVYFCKSPSILDMLTALLLDQPSSALLDMVAHHIATTPQTVALLAANDHILNALLDVCNTHPALKERAKKLVLRLVPNL